MNYDKLNESLFNGKMTEKQRDGVELILKAGENMPVEQLGYVLATIYHETAKAMQPVTEYGSEAYLKAKDYYPFIGRGLVQITWEDNYRKFGKLLGVDLVGNPELALEAKISTDIALIGMTQGLFRKVNKQPAKLSNYFNAEVSDPVNARLIINGIRKGEKLPDKAELIASYYHKFLDALKES